MRLGQAHIGYYRLEPDKYKAKCSYSKLRPLEKTVALMTAEGSTVREIAFETDFSDRYIQRVQQDVLRKMWIENKIQLVLCLVYEGVITQDRIGEIVLTKLK